MLNFRVPSVTDPREKAKKQKAESFAVSWSRTRPIRVLSGNRHGTSELSSAAATATCSFSEVFSSRMAQQEFRNSSNFFFLFSQQSVGISTLQKKEGKPRLPLTSGWEFRQSSVRSWLKRRVQVSPPRMLSPRLVARVPPFIVQGISKSLATFLKSFLQMDGWNESCGSVQHSVLSQAFWFRCYSSF